MGGLLNPANPLNLINPASPWYHIYNNSTKDTPSQEKAATTVNQTVTTVSNTPDPSFILWILLAIVIIGGGVAVYVTTRE